MIGVGYVDIDNVQGLVGETAGGVYLKKEEGTARSRTRDVMQRPSHPLFQVRAIVSSWTDNFDASTSWRLL